MTRDPNRSLVNAAKRGNVDAQYQLAAMLATGDGTEKDVAAAAQLYAKAAAKNHPEALYNLGLMYILGEIGKPAVKKGMAMLKRAAKLDSWDAHWYLAHVFMVGLHGEPRDLDKAAYYSVLSLRPEYKRNVPSRSPTECRSPMASQRQSSPAHWSRSQRRRGSGRDDAGLSCRMI